MNVRFHPWWEDLSIILILIAAACAVAYVGGVWWRG